MIWKTAEEHQVACKRVVLVKERAPHHWLHASSQEHPTRRKTLCSEGDASEEYERVHPEEPCLHQTSEEEVAVAEEEEAEGRSHRHLFPSPAHRLGPPIGERRPLGEWQIDT